MKPLRIDLGTVPVGWLTPVPSYPDRWRFSFRQDYRELYPRPILGQFFEDDLERSYVSTQRLPEFFSNLLPEGALRELIAEKAGVDPAREAQLLALLGEDLPGALFVREADEGAPDSTEEAENGVSDSADDENGGQPLKFSLAGVQLKFSVVRREGGFTLPATGRGGHWIVKLPDYRFEGLPENEWSLLTWARKAGILVPDHELVPAAEIRNLPWESVGGRSQKALAVRRYDRTEGGGRIHQEDFAQVFGVSARKRYKYEKASYENIGRILHALGGVPQLLEYVDRLVFVVLSGNGDAHLKNWSLWYPDPLGRNAALSPAYDQVSTLSYVDGQEDLALKLGKERDFYRISASSFHRLARKCEVSEAAVSERVQEAVERIRSAFREVEDDLALAPDAAAALRRHLDRIKL
jgi:serine/threonine-protein kinase HipA